MQADLIAKAVKTVELIVNFKCQGCGNLHEEECDAEYCCPPEEVFICPVCEEEFWSETIALDHLQKPHGGALTMEEEYFEEVLLEGRPTLGLWAFELEKKISEPVEVK